MLIITSSADLSAFCTEWAQSMPSRLIFHCFGIRAISLLTCRRHRYHKHSRFQPIIYYLASNSFNSPPFYLSFSLFYTYISPSIEDISRCETPICRRRRLTTCPSVRLPVCLLAVNWRGNKSFPLLSICATSRRSTFPTNSSLPISQY